MANEKEWLKVEDADRIEWKFIKGKEELSGEFTGKEIDVGPNKSIIYNVKKDGKDYFFWGKTILDARLKNIEVGEELKVVFIGMKTPKKGGKDYYDYDVFHRKADFKKVEVAEEEIPVIEEGEDNINTKDIPF